LPGHESITVNGQTFRDLDEIPDPALREQVHSLMTAAGATITDPTVRQKFEQELEDVGIEPREPPSPDAQPPA
jgi:hypothetical protein